MKVVGSCGEEYSQLALVLVANVKY